MDGVILGDLNFFVVFVKLSKFFYSEYVQFFYSKQFI